MKLLFTFLFTCLCFTSEAQKKAIEQTINQWHKAAETADFKTYFNLMTEEAVFVGSDASEVWNYREFKAFAKPYFDAGKAWTFTPVHRNVYLSPNQQMAWFDETLDSKHMGVCRGSGVLTMQKDETWKIAHYVLSIAIPNPDVDKVVILKEKLDKAYLKTID
jgi:ketosteroid isomerase-like protein